MAASSSRASLLGMSTRERLPAALGLLLLLAVGVAVAVRLPADAGATSSPLTAQALPLPLDGTCYVVAVPGATPQAPPPPPPRYGEPSPALAAWLSRTRANPVGTSRTLVGLIARDATVTVTAVEVDGEQNPPLLHRDWALDSRCRPGTTAPVDRSGPGATVALTGDLDEVAGGRHVTLSPDPADALPLRLAPGTSATLVLDLRARTRSTRWSATVRWTAGGVSGATVVDQHADGLTLLSGDRVTVHYGWDVVAGRWVTLPAGAGP